MCNKAVKTLLGYRQYRAKLSSNKIYLVPHLQLVNVLDERVELLLPHLQLGVEGVLAGLERRPLLAHLRQLALSLGARRSGADDLREREEKMFSLCC